MAIPWYSSEFHLESPPDSNLKLFSTDKSALHRKLSARNNVYLSVSPVHDLFSSKSSKLHNLPERDIDKISAIPEVVDEDHLVFDRTDDYSGHDLCHNGVVNRAFLPMRLALIAVGRWPVPMTLKAVRTRRGPKMAFESSENQKRFVFERTLPTAKIKNYDDTLKSPLWLYFGFTTLFIFFVLVMSTVGFFDFFLEWKLLPGNHWKCLDRTIFRDNLVVFLLIWGCLVHATVSSFSLFIKRKKVAKIMNFWNVAADQLLLYEIKSHRRFLIASNIGYILFLVLLYLGFSHWNVRLITDGAALFGILTIRSLFGEDKAKNVEEWKLQVFGFVTIIYSVYASRAFLFIFCFKCRLLRSMFRGWNARLVRFLRSPEISPNDKSETSEILEKMECERLLNDMTILLKLVKQMDIMFAAILQAYYCVQLLNMCFELYMLAKSGNEEFTRNKGNGLDIITAGLTLCQNVYFFFTVSLDGAYVGEEAAKGLEALRRHPITPQSSVQKKYLIYNLSFIYNQKIALTGGKFFTLDRPFIITVLGAVLTYFVIILQVGPSLQRET